MEFKYKQAYIRTEQEIKQAEKLVKQGFKIIMAGIDYVLMEKKLSK
jgi:hypothetical protein